MRRLRAAFARLTGLLSLPDRERRFAEELEIHIQMHADDNVRAGMTPEEARRQALVALGGLESTRQAYRERSTVPLLENLARDTRFALRQLMKTPGFTATAVITLALGMAACLAVFAFVHAALIKPLPYPEPGRLVEVTERTPEIPLANLSYPDFLDWERMNSVVSSLDVHIGRASLLTTPEGTQLVRNVRVSDGFFRTLGVAPELGRDFHTGEDRPGGADVVIISHAAWHARFGGARDIIGRTVTLDTIPHTVIGVLPRDFHFAPREPAEFWTPFRAVAGCDVQRVCHALIGVARLKDGVSVEEAFADFDRIAKTLEQQYPDTNRGQGASVRPLATAIAGDLRPTLLTMLGGAGLLLLIACVNVSSLLLVRGESRRRELAVRSALGASRLRLASQFVTEAIVLVTASSVLGLALATAAMQLLADLVPTAMRESMPYLAGIGPNGPVLGAAALISLAAVALFSLAPIVRAGTPDIRAGVAGGGRGTAATTWKRLGFRLVVVELATAMVLLAGAGLLGKSLYRLLNVELGFNPDGLATVNVAAPRSSYGEDDRAAHLARDVVSRVGAVPGVRSVGITSVLPVSFNGNTDWLRFVGRPFHGEHNEVLRRDVTPDYFRTLGATLLRGRSFTDHDDASRPRVAIINRTLAEQYYPGEDPIGQRIGDMGLSPDSIKEIVGIVDDIREGPLGEEIWPAVYYPFAQGPDAYFSVAVRTSIDEGSMLLAIGAAIRGIDPGIGTIRESVMRERIRNSPAAYLQRSSAWLVGGFAALALLLAVVGLYGVMSYSVSQRTREMGVRLAMGAERRAVYQLVLREAGKVAALGIVFGLLGAVTAATLTRTLLFGTPPWDAATMAAVALVLAAAAMLASYFPARRAASIDPGEVLRVE